MQKQSKSLWVALNQCFSNLGIFKTSVGLQFAELYVVILPNIQSTENLFGVCFGITMYPIFSKLKKQSLSSMGCKKTSGCGPKLQLSDAYTDIQHMFIQFCMKSIDHSIIISGSLLDLKELWLSLNVWSCIKWNQAIGSSYPVVSILALTLNKVGDSRGQTGKRRTWMLLKELHIEYQELFTLLPPVYCMDLKHNGNRYQNEINCQYGPFVHMNGHSLQGQPFHLI